MKYILRESSDINRYIRYILEEDSNEEKPQGNSKLPDFEKDNDKYWQEGMSANRIINSLNKWTIDKMNDEYFRFNNINDKDLSIILKAFNINIPAKLYKPAELRKLKVSIKL